MSERPTSSIIERVRKILSKTAEAGCTQAEADNAFALASRLMAEHNLSMGDVEAKDGQADEFGWIEDAAHETSRWTLEQNLAYGIVKEFCFVEGFFIHKYKGVKTTLDGETYVESKLFKVLMFFGRGDNVDAARWMFQALLDAYGRLWTTYRTLTRAPASDRRIFIAGVAQGFSQKMRDERKAMEIERDLVKGDSGGTALALRSVAAETTQKFREAKPVTKKSRGSTFTEASGSTSALQAGINAGKHLNLNRAVEGKAQKGIGG